MSEHPILMSAPLVRAVLNTLPDDWPPKPVDPAKPIKWQTRRVVKNLKIRMRETVTADYPRIMDPGQEFIARANRTYNATLNPHGAVSAVMPNGKGLGVKPGEFDFVCPYGLGKTVLVDRGHGGKDWQIVTGDTLWMRETWAKSDGGPDEYPLFHYAADHSARHYSSETNCSSIFPQSYSGKWRPSIYMPRWACRLFGRVIRIRLQRLHAITAAEIMAEGVVAGAHEGPFGKQPVSAFDGKAYLDLISLWAAGWDGINAKRGFPFKDNPWVWAIDFMRTEAVR